MGHRVGMESHHFIRLISNVTTVDSVITHTSFLRVISTVSNRSALGILGRISSGWWPLNECLKKELSTVHLWQSTKKGGKRVWVMTESTVQHVFTGLKCFASVHSQ